MRNPDGKFNAKKNIFTDAFGQKIRNIHPQFLCEGRNCPIHNPSHHPLRKAKIFWRKSGAWDIKPSHMERICKHGVGHPDPDDLAYWEAHGVQGMGVHGCDGCCRKEEK